MATRLSQFLNLRLNASSRVMSSLASQPNRGGNAHKSFEEMLERKPPPSIGECNDLMVHNATLHHYEKVIEMYRGIVVAGIHPDVSTMHIIISCYACFRKWGFCLSLLGRFLKVGLQPSLVTYHALSEDLILNKRVGDALSFYKDMMESGNFEPDESAYRSIIHRLCWLGRLKEARMVWNKMENEHFKQIESLVERAVKEKPPFERIEVSREQAFEMFSDNRFKVEIINGLPEDKAITVYRCGPLVDLCDEALACRKASFKGLEHFRRIYKLSFLDEKHLKAHVEEREEKKICEHGVLGITQELFFFNRVSPGSCFFLPKGTLIYEKLVNFIKKLYRKRGYQQVRTPEMYNVRLWETSGHAKEYKNNIFWLEINKQEFGLKPMNCPAHCVIFKEKARSYKELPLRLVDFGVLHRNEASSAFNGLKCARTFQQDDAHIFCRESQVKDELRGALEFLEYTYKIFGFTFKLNLSTMPEDHIGDLATWEKAESTLKEVLDEFGKPWEVKKGDGAFYGPKIDITLSDAMNRHHQLGTLQLDFQLPDRFDLHYSAEGEVRMERPVMIHKAILGSVERMFAILLEHYKGKWPFWLSPCQAIVCPVLEKFQPYAKKVRDHIHGAGYEVDLDTSDKTLPRRIREAQIAQYNYILVVGAEEVQNRKVNVRCRDNDEKKSLSLEDLLQHFKEDVEAFR